MIVEVFDDLKSIFHFFLGFITPILPHLGLAIALIYFLYQSWEKEKIRSKKGDVLEFLTGAGCWTLIKVMIAVL